MGVFYLAVVDYSAVSTDPEVIDLTGGAGNVTVYNFLSGRRGRPSTMPDWFVAAFGPLFEWDSRLAQPDASETGVLVILTMILVAYGSELPRQSPPPNDLDAHRKAFLLALTQEK